MADRLRDFRDQVDAAAAMAPGLDREHVDIVARAVHAALYPHDTWETAGVDRRAVCIRGAQAQILAQPLVPEYLRRDAIAGLIFGADTSDYHRAGQLAEQVLALAHARMLHPAVVAHQQQRST